MPIGEFIFILNTDWMTKKQLDVNQSFIKINIKEIKEVKIKKHEKYKRNRNQSKKNNNKKNKNTKEIRIPTIVGVNVSVRV